MEFGFNGDVMQLNILIGQPQAESGYGHRTQLVSKVKGLTVDGKQDGLEVALDADDRREALEARLVVAGVRQVAVRPALAAVDDAPQAAPARQTGVVRELELRGDVAPIDEEFDARRRVAAERDAAQRRRPAVDDVDAGGRRRLLGHEVVVRYYNPMHRHCTRRAPFIHFPTSYITIITIIIYEFLLRLSEKEHRYITVVHEKH